MERETLLRRVRTVVRELEPEAEIILYGSRSRLDAGPESDWDFVILVDGPVDEERTDRIRHRLYEIEWDGDEVISSVVRSREQWNSARYRAVPFRQAVEREGVTV